MITGTLQQWRQYMRILPPYLAERLHWASWQDWSAYDDGKIVLSARDYVNVESGLTEPASRRKWEAHRDYLDIHVLLAGREQIDWAELPETEPTESYPERDLYFYSPGIVAQGHLEMQPGMFAVMYPWDLHRPLMATGEPTRVRKAIMKLVVPRD